MSTINRRNFLKLAGISSIAAAGFVASPNNLNFKGVSRAYAQSNGMAGQLFIQPGNTATIHTYVSPEQSAAVTSHIIETANNLYLIDTQFAEPFANELKTYIEGLGKPLERIFLSHQHQDHWSGGQLFDADFVTTDAIAAGVAEEIEAGDGGFGTPRAPEGGMTAGTEVLDGLTVEFEIVNDAEAPEHLLLKMPELGAIIVQDLLYTDSHAFPLGNNENWINILNSFRSLTEEGYRTILAGHGFPAGFGQIDDQIEYLNLLSETLASASNAEEAQAALIEAYPSYGVVFITSFISAAFS